MNKTLLLAGASAFALTLGMTAPSYAADGANAKAEGDSTGNTAIDDNSKRLNDTFGSWNGGATGVVHNQQNNGNNNAINAATAVHADVTGGTKVESEAVTDSDTAQNDTDHSGTHEDAPGPDRHNKLIYTMSGFVGTATHQQNNGDNNAINSATAIDGIDGDADGFDQDAIAGATSNHNSGEPGFSTADRVIGVNHVINVNPDAGVFTVQQNNGSANGMSSSTAVGGTTGSAGDIDQLAHAATKSNDNDSDAHSTFGGNTIRNSFNDFSGVATVQQNNGDSNAMAASTAVLGAGDDVGTIRQDVEVDSGDDGAVGNQSGDQFSTRENVIDPSFNSSEGVITVQQNNGNGNAVSAGTAVAAVLGSAESLTQRVVANSENSGASFNVTDDKNTKRSNTIGDSSFNQTKGIISVQQNNGDANSMNIGNAVAAVTGEAGVVDQMVLVGEAHDDQDSGTAFNTVDSVGTAYGKLTRRNYIEDMHGMDGVVTVQQNNGDANSISAGNAVAATYGAGSITQNVAAEGVAANNETNDTKSQRGNMIDTAAHGFDGVMTVQQNNGSANSMAVANAVAASMGDAGTVDQTVNAEGGWMRMTNADDDASERTNKIEGSFHGLDGIVTVQQNNGDVNNMNVANGVVAVTGEAGNSTQNANAWGQTNGTDLVNFDHGTGWDKGNKGPIPLPHRDNDIDPSFNNVTGIVNVQQNNGNGNSINAANAALVTLDGGEDTDQTVSAGGNSEHNNTVDFHSTRRNTLDDASFDNFEGMATLQQNNGDSNVMSAANGVVANISDDGKLNNAVQTVSTNTRTHGNNSLDLNMTFDPFITPLGNRVNRINEDVFNGAQGIVTIQQNNGNGNAMATATGVRADIGSTESDAPNLEQVTVQDVSTTGIVDSYNHSIEVSLPNGQVPPGPKDFERANLLTNAFEGGVNGIFTIQQNNGDGNNMGAATGVAANINSSGDIDSTLDNDASTTGTVMGAGDFDGALDLWANRHNTIKDPIFSGAAGIMTVQQNNGNNNVMGSAVGVVANVNTVKHVGEGGAIADSSGTATVDGNGSISTSFTDRLNTIDGAFTGAQGVMTVQQNNGDNNVMGAATDVVATTEEPGFGPAASNATLGATVSNNFALNTGTVGEPGYSNSLTGSFTGASGVMTVQQNNGNNSAMQSAVSVIANGISFDFN
jgi:hypothetical protein